MRPGHLEVDAKDAASEGALGGSARASIKGWCKARSLNRLTEKTQRCASIMGIEVGGCNCSRFQGPLGFL